ncbi:hypothetical protein DI005_24310 [Prauserella sp. PE36]|uniref:Uncharacterized protein n=1 Tax=Prauserella endophytica TaxID=1592324 RepID=A0ABY2RXT8_9PSEU|nr:MULTISPECIES: hypothetical protein [Prauserella]PXY23677.1 hypothetical protein BAY59_28970 [Prauserella coralliicola]RBM16736.1 hypothetical protein DI005_24310 [Prauserella sp. PE36]TKG64884.1 hypothetical protein FCN18_27945 [Prauserella endophytica]
MFGSALASPRRVLDTALRAGRAAHAAIEALPRIAALLGDLRETGEQLERLSVFAAQELPEIVYQLEAMRAQLTAIERRLTTPGADGQAVTPGSPRTGSRRPS